MRTSLQEFQQYCLRKNLAFVSYVMPGEHDPVTLFASNAKVFKSIEEVDDRRGFLISPFQAEKYPVLVIPNESRLEGWEFDKKNLPSASVEDQAPVMDSVADTVSFSEYAKQVEEIKRNLSLGKAKKVVLSRTKTWNRVDANLLPDVFSELVTMYPHAFVYILFTVESGVWLGATPESLIEITKTNFSTMALAGTKAFSDGDKPTDWTSKEIKEQEYVVSYVRQKLAQGGYSYNESARETVRAGNVVHLRTLFSGELCNNNSEWKKLIHLLYPTPAICGTDDGSTLQLIQKVENHKREYYAGIVGPFDASDKSRLFINLRCMKVIGNTALLFAGGGILSESSAEKEWEETELKFDTLIRVVQKVMGRVKEAR